MYTHTVCLSEMISQPVTILSPSSESMDASSQEVRIKFVDEIFRIESRSNGDGSAENGDTHDGENDAHTPILPYLIFSFCHSSVPPTTPDEEGETRKKKPDCSHCHDNHRRKCKVCACSVCGGKDQPANQILCDDCDQAFHIWCLSPPLEQVPEEDEW